MVLGLVAVPPARIQRAAPTGTPSWTHFSKWGHFAPCHLPGSRARLWNAYPGGFYIDSATACVPLRITARGRSRTVRVGIGTACPS